MMIPQDFLFGNTLDAALAYTGNGWPVIPLKAREKVPATPHGFEDATCEEHQVRDWFTNSMYNIGIATGAASGLVVVDVDCHRSDGKAAWIDLLKRNAGEDAAIWWDVTNQYVATGGGGYHILFRHPGGVVPSRVSAIPGIDLRADGAYIVAPPSIHPETGTTYVWKKTLGELPALPDWLLNAFQRDVKALPVAHPSSYPAAAVQDEELIQRAKQADNGEKFNRLWEGTWEGDYGSQSAADLAFCSMLAFWTCRDTERMDTLFRQSGLYRAKWDKIHSGNGRTYGEMTITFAAENTKEVWTRSKRIIEVPATSPLLLGAESAQVLIQAEDRDYYKFTELHDAETVMTHVGANLRYCKALGGWLVYSDSVWRKDDESANRIFIASMKETVCDGILSGDKDAINSASKRLGAYHLSNAFKLARAVDGVGANSGQFDDKPWLINFPNGVLDLQTQGFFGHRPDDYLTKVLDYAYDPQATCPRWERFLSEITGSDTNLIGFLQRAVGYSLTGRVTDHALFLLWGSGRNGKGKFIETVRKLLAPYAENLEVRSLMKTHQRGMPNDIARLRGARFVTASESEQKQELDAARVKALTGGDTLTGEYKYGEQFDFAPTHKLWLSTNYRPAVTDHTASIWDRMKLIPFRVRFRDPSEPGDDPVADTELEATLARELPGILNWAVQGCRDWQEYGLGTADEIQNITREYRLENDPVEAFIEECCTRHPGSEVAASALYERYKAWCMTHGLFTVSSTDFGNTLRDKSFTKRKRNGPWFYQNLTLG